MNNKTAIDTIVKYSKECIALRFIKNHLQKSLSLIKRLPITFFIPSADSLKIVIEELDLKIKERENDVGKFLIPLFEGNDFGHKNSIKHSLTIQEIKDGYMVLGGEEYVILLRPFKSSTTGFSYEPGVLYKIGSGIRQEDLDLIKPFEEAIINNDLLNVVIKKKTAYEYLE